MLMFFAGHTKQDNLNKLVCMICYTDLMSESVCVCVCGNLQPRFAQAQCEPTGNDSDYGRAACKRKRSEQ